MSTFFSYITSFFYSGETDNIIEEEPVVLDIKDPTPELINLIYRLDKNPRRIEEISSFLKEHPIKTLNLKKSNNYGTNLMILPITYEIDEIFIKILAEKIFSPDELREMKNSMGHNLITICRLFNKDRYSRLIRNYVKYY